MSKFTTSLNTDTEKRICGEPKLLEKIIENLSY